MAAYCPAFCTPDDTSEEDSLIPAGPVVCPSKLCPHLFPSALDSLKQFLSYELRIVFCAKVAWVFQYPANGCMGPGHFPFCIAYVSPFQVLGDPACRHSAVIVCKYLFHNLSLLFADGDFSIHNFIADWHVPLHPVHLPLRQFQSVVQAEGDVVFFGDHDLLRCHFKQLLVKLLP